MERGAHLRFRLIPPILDPTQWPASIAKHMMLFESMDATLEAQHMLQRIILEIWTHLIVRLDAEVALEQLIFSWRGEWAAANGCEHLRAAVVVRDGHHC